MWFRNELSSSAQVSLYWTRLSGCGLYARRMASPQTTNCLCRRCGVFRDAAVRERKDWFKSALNSARGSTVSVQPLLDKRQETESSVTQPSTSNVLLMGKEYLTCADGWTTYTVNGANCGGSSGKFKLWTCKGNSNLRTRDFLDCTITDSFKTKLPDPTSISRLLTLLMCATHQ